MIFTSKRRKTCLLSHIYSTNQTDGWFRLSELRNDVNTEKPSACCRYIRAELDAPFSPFFRFFNLAGSREFSQHRHKTHIPEILKASGFSQNNVFYSSCHGFCSASCFLDVSLISSFPACFCWRYLPLI